jgi:hypothetical protein
MESFWMRALDDAEQAEVRARTMRERFGENAEDRCRAELQSFSEHDPRRRRIADVFRALRWT